MSVALLLVNLGTPSSPEPKDVKAYLKEFLMDPHVIDLPTWQRWILIHGLIAPLRSKRSAKAYKKIWMDEGSPLMVHSQALKKKVAAAVGKELTVDLAMRYGEPAIHDRLDALAAQGMDRILVLPLYPQYADSSTGTVIDHISQWKDARESRGELKPLKIEILRDFPSFAPFIDSLQANYAETVPPEVDHVLISFHSLPERHLTKVYAGCRPCIDAGECPRDYSERPLCYRAQCFDTARSLTSRLGLEKSSVSFQSKLTREPWLTPATDQEVERLAAEGIKSLAILCPSFVSDCLETLEEIGIEARKQFLQRGGEQFFAVPCPNDGDIFAEGLTHFAKQWLRGHCSLNQIIL